MPELPRQKPNEAGTSLDRADTLLQAGRVGEAADAYARALAQHGPTFELLQRLGFARQAAGDLSGAIESYRHCLALNPDAPEVHNNLGTVLELARRPADAIECFRRALELRPDYVRPLINLGKVLRGAGDPASAIEHLRRALTLSPGNPRALTNLGFALLDVGRIDEAGESFRSALEGDPRLAEAHHGRGRALLEAGDLPAALASLQQAILLQPDLVDAHVLCGKALLQHGRRVEAARYFQRAIAVNPQIADAHCYLGLAILNTSGHVPAALASFERALALDGTHWRALLYRAGALTLLQRLPDALASIERASVVRPDDIEIFSEKLNCCIKMCDWPGAHAAWERLLQLYQTTQSSLPFVQMAVSDDPAVHLGSAASHARAILRGRGIIEAPQVHRHDKIRVAYVSRDFFTHATLSLMGELFELHDRSSFEILAASFGPDDHSAMRARIVAACDEFIDVTAKPDAEAAQVLRAREIDIAVDLKGYTAFARPGIFAYRPAPIQVSYLGYPGTTAAPFMDYLIADDFLIPEPDRHFYTESIAYLPDSYQVNDRKRRVAETTPSRAAEGLPDHGVVFCCFNNNWKITEEIFAVWMRVLSGAEGSVLWLLEDNPWAAANLRQAARGRGVSPQRLIFCRRLSAEQHLARHRLADLFLDTLPYNAHTTASDALWTGLPIVTCAGRSFAARVAGSLLRAVGLGELVTTTLEEYERLALALARDPARLRALRSRLLRARDTAPLFDTPRFCRHLEAAYRQMWLTHSAGRPAQTFRVEPAREEAGMFRVR